MYDLYYLLKHLRDKANEYARILEVEEGYIKVTVPDILDVRNTLAHQKYLSHDAASKTTHERSVEYTSKYINKGIEFAEEITENINPKLEVRHVR